MAIERIVDNKQADPTQAELLKLARSEGPSAEARARILSNLDSAMAAAALASLPVAGATAAAAGTASRGFFKWLAIVGVGVTLPVAGLFGFRALNSGSLAEAPRTEVTTAKGPAAPTALPEAKREQAPSTTASIQTIDVAELPLATTRPVAATSQDMQRAKEPTLAEELAAIRRARQAVSRGDGATGLRELDVYKARFPRGRLKPEASVLRIEALVQTGDRATATELGRRFIAANPQSAYAARLRSLLGLDQAR